jgi:hypothetical protein
MARKKRPCNKQISAANRLYYDFTGHEPENLGVINVPDAPSVGVVIGDVEGIIYNTVRDGVFERYIHKFAKNSRPLFVVSPDGKQLLLVGGNFTFTERGIVDKKG